jgi:hypothetical protein
VLTQVGLDLLEPNPISTREHGQAHRHAPFTLLEEPLGLLLLVRPVLSLMGRPLT